MNGPSFRVRVEPSIRSIPAATWDACARGEPVAFTRSSAANELEGLKKITGVEAVCEDDHDNPFITHDFLASLEEAGAAVPRTGWPGRHLLVEAETRATLAATPAYLKSHSRGWRAFGHG